MDSRRLEILGEDRNRGQLQEDLWEQQNNRTTEQQNNRTTEQQNNRTTEQQLIIEQMVSLRDCHTK